jgi:heat shock protein HslJ/membrane-bound inhibitor of C-type lysozyme
MRSKLAFLLSLALFSACSRTPDAPPPDLEPTRLYCGERVVEVRYAGERAWLTVGETTYVLRQVVAASGAKYQAEADTATTLWNKGERTLVIVAGERFAECSSEPPVGTAFHASGHEPEWHLTIDGDGLRFTRALGAEALRAATPAVTDSIGWRRYSASVEGKELAVTVFDQPCADSMTGMPHPQRVEVAFDGEIVSGCGGSTAEFLRQGEWQLEALNGVELVAASRITLLFTLDGRVAGFAACNRYGGQFELSGEGIRFSGLFNTRMACAPELMDQETRFLATLAEVNQLALGADGALRLSTPDGRELIARRG